MTDMDAAMRAELSARIASQQNTIAMWASSAAGRAPHMEAMARTDSGNSWFDIAVCRMLLGDDEGAATAFAEAARSLHAAAEVASPPSIATYQAALESAVLAGDATLAESVASAPVAPEPRPSLVGDRLAWALALPALVLGDDATAAVYGREAAAVAEKSAWYPGLGDAVVALVDGDAAALGVALGRVLDKHAGYARTKKSWCYNWGPCLLCVPATVLARLGAQRGMPVDVTRRETVPFTLMFTAPKRAVDASIEFVPHPLAAP